MTEPYRIRSPETWARARDDYLAGLDAETVCRRHDLGLSAFRRRARKYGWRRIDQADPAPGDLDLSIYDDLEPEDHIEMARLRFSRALTHGKPIEAARWRRLWRQLCDERDLLNAEFFAGMGPAEVAAVLAADAPDDETQAEIRLLSASPRDALPAPAARPAPPENVHDVHAVFSGAQSAPDGSPAPTRARPPPSGPGPSQPPAGGTLRNSTRAAP